MNKLRIILGKLGLPLPKGKWRKDTLRAAGQALDEGDLGSGTGHVSLGFLQSGLQCLFRWHGISSSQLPA